MALTPGIALGYRPPALQPLDIQSPLERFGKVLTLRGMMEQQQLRGLQMQGAQQELEQNRRANEGLAEFQRRVTAGETLTPGQSLGYLGPKAGAEYLKSQADIEKAKLDRITQLNTIHVNNAKRRAQIAAGASDLETAKKAVWQTYQEQAFDPDPVKNSQIARETLKHLEDNGFIPDEWKQHAQESLDFVAREDLKIKLEEEARKKERAPFELRTAIAGATKAEDEAAGKQPITLQQKAQAEQQLWTSDGGLISILNDPARSPADKARAQAGLQKYESLKRAGAATTSVITPNQNIGNEAKLRDDYRADSKEYIGIRNAFSKISSAAKAGTAIGDMSLVFALMKLQDPGSTVRESEQADARNAAGVPDRIRTIWNNLIAGERLSPEQRADMVARAKEIYDQSYADYGKTREMYTGIAERNGMDPRNVVIDYSPAGLSTVMLKDGRTATFPSGAAAEAFRRDNPDLVK